jgi:DNA-binding IclR family transcriptional regulator
MNRSKKDAKNKGEWNKIIKMFPNDKTLKVFSLLQFINEKPRTIVEIEKKLKVSKRSVYRYIDVLIALKVEVNKDTGSFYIPSYTCFCCGKKVG